MSLDLLRSSLVPRKFLVEKKKFGLRLRKQIVL